jgi:ATP-dependent RNA helicase RhlE
MPFHSRRPGGAFTSTRKTYGGGSSSTSSFSRGGRSGSGGRSNKSRGKQYIDPRKFVSKAVEGKVEVEYVPEHLFSDFAFDPQIQANLLTSGYITPTPIQDKSIMSALEKRDILGIANTGTGKTAAFLLPLIQHTLEDRDHHTTLILAPTRELALQIEKEFQGFTKGMRLGSAAIIGGSPLGPQMNLLRRDPHFIIGTPGRVKDMIERRLIHLNRFSAVVLDEVDRMLDMGFVDEIRRILDGLNPERQSMFFSATLSPSIATLIDSFLQDPVKISVKTAETADSVEQNIVNVPAGQQKIDVLHDLLIKDGFDRVLVFGETKFGVERLAKNLEQRGFKATAIHGNKTQGQRNRAIEAFKRGEAKILVATDVAARGLDIKDVSHVINFDTPTTYDDYVHRIGRTGRGGKKGHALTFID